MKDIINAQIFVDKKNSSRNVSEFDPKYSVIDLDNADEVDKAIFNELLLDDEETEVEQE